MANVTCNGTLVIVGKISASSRFEHKTSRSAGQNLPSEPPGPLLNLTHIVTVFYLCLNLCYPLLRQTKLQQTIL